MKVLVTGAGGFVCRHIVAALIDAGHSVIALDLRFDADLRRDWDHRVELIEGDVMALPMTQVDVLIHGAAVTGSPDALGQTPMENFRANLDTALAVMDWALVHAQRAVFISSNAVYDRTAPGPVTEAEHAARRGMYSVAKYTIERLVETFVGDYGCQWTAVRFSNVYGTGELPRTTRPRVSLIGQMVYDAVSAGTVTVAAEPARDWTFAADIGRAVVALLASPHWKYALYNIASEQRTTAAAITAQLQSLIPGIRVVDASSAKAALTRLGYLTNARLREQTGFNDWTPLHEGLAQTVAWQQRQLAKVAHS